MAIFKRSARDTSDQHASADAPVTADGDTDVDDSTGDSVDRAAAPVTDPASPGAAAETVPHVGISVSTYGRPAAAAAPSGPAPAGPGAAAASSARAVTRPPAEAPARTETIAGMPDNTLVQAALSALPDKPGNADVMNVMRQSMQGTLYVRVRGDARALTAAGEQLTLAVSQMEGSRFLLAFTGGAALRSSVEADGDTDTSALGLAASAVFRNVIEGPYEGLIIDHSVPGARIILPAALIKKAFEEGDPAHTVKNLLTAPRDADTAGAVGRALVDAPLWVAARAAGPDGQLGLAESRTASGERRLEIYSHPLEVLVLDRGDRPIAVTADQVGRALQANAALTGVIVDPAGPWIHVDRDALGPVLEVAAASESAVSESAASESAASESADQPAPPAQDT